MAIVDTILVPKFYKLTVSPDGAGLGHLVRVYDNGNQPDSFQALSASTPVSVGPFDVPSKWRVTLVGGSYSFTNVVSIVPSDNPDDDSSYATLANLAHNAPVSQGSNVDASGAGPYTLSSADAAVQVTVSHDCTLSPSFTASEVRSLKVILINGGANTLTWTGVTWPGGSQPSFSASGTDLVELFCDSSGNIYGHLIGAAFA